MDNELDKAVQSEWKITLYRNVLGDELVKKFLDLLKELAKAIPDKNKTLTSYYNFATSFIPKAAELAVPERNAWEDYIVELIIRDDNFYTRLAESREYENMPDPVKIMVNRDIAELQRIAAISNTVIRNVLKVKLGTSVDVDSLPNWEGIFIREDREDEETDSLKSYFHNLDSWEKGIKYLSGYYITHGVGIFGLNHSFRWVKTENGGRLEGVKVSDSIRLDQLYEYQREQKKLIDNTEQFLAGYSANNVLLYGDRGTGKSSTVKALVNKYGKNGLRLIEIQKQDIRDFPLVVSQLAEHPQKFILFIDDLSFTEQEGQFRELKALLEGGLEVRPQNVLVYATSNRRHLVQESFADKKITGYDPDNEDVRYMDTVQEKLSLADRFGITVTYTSPDQIRYLKIIEKMAKERRLEISPEELKEKALRWELKYNARSARTAKQFIDNLEGQLALRK